jgi:hypothetical protein
MALGEAAEQQVAFQAPAIAALMEQALAADANRFGHDGVRGVATSRWATM